MRLIAVLLLLFAAPVAATPTEPFSNIDGGTISLSDFAGRPVLLVNTASQCGFTGQYAGLQALYDTYREAGLVVLAVPSDDFNQELASATEVKEFCEVQFGLDLPMTDITPVIGAEAHPVYAWIRDQTGFTPSWNFNKVLIDAAGEIVATYGATIRPDAPRIVTTIEALLKDR
ncbi:MAG: glutathione peroxidase [Pseudomonadota bacterium]